jgi:hypothetical protein
VEINPDFDLASLIRAKGGFEFGTGIIAEKVVTPAVSDCG